MEKNSRFDEMLDQVYPSYRIGDLEFYPSDILFNCDPISYHVESVDFVDSLQDDE